MKKGGLLYQEDWVKERKFEGPYILIFTFIIFLFGIFIGVIGLYLFLNPGENNQLSILIYFLSLGTLVGSIGYYLFTTLISKMPFKIYEKGFTFPKASAKEGLKRKEKFSSWEKVELISLEDLSPHNSDSKIIKIYLINGEEILLNSDDFTKPLSVFNILNDLVPEKLDEEIQDFLNNADKKERPFDFKPSVAWEFKYFAVYFVVVLLITLGSLFFFSSLSKNDTFVTILGILITSAGYFFLYLIIKGHENFERFYIRRGSKPESNRIQIPKTNFESLIYDKRSSIPFTEIKKCMLRLHPYFFFHEGEIETTYGENYRVPLDVYKKLENDSRFLKKGDVLINRSPKSGHPIFTYNYLKISLLVLISSSFLFLGFYFS